MDQRPAGTPEDNDLQATEAAVAAQPTKFAGAFWDPAGQCIIINTVRAYAADGDALARTLSSQGESTVRRHVRLVDVSSLALEALRDDVSQNGSYPLLASQSPQYSKIDARLPAVIVGVQTATPVQLQAARDRWGSQVRLTQAAQIVLESSADDNTGR